MEAVESKKRAGRNRQLTERDRELCGFLAVCRYLTREQIEKLIFPGRTKARSSTRLRQLASRMRGQAAVVRGDLGYASAEGWTTVWALTAEGVEIGSQLLNLKLARTPKHDVGPWFLKHEVMLNEVFLTPSEARRDSIGRVSADRESSDKYRFAARALTLAESRRVLCLAQYGAYHPPRAARQGPRTVSPATAPPVPPRPVAEVPAR